MTRLPQITTDLATPEQQDLLDATQHQLGRVPNLYRTMANSPAALNGYLAFRAALTRGVLGPAIREQLALLIAELNSCRYCISAHTLRGTKMGMSPAELLDVRSAHHSNPHTDAVLQFARSVAINAGHVSDDDLTTARAAGITDAELAEIVAHVALNTYSNSFSHIAQPDLDFPAVDPLTTLPTGGPA